MSEQITPIPEGFLGKLLDAFGLQWTHLVILSGIAFTSFGLETFLDPGLWILGTIVAFAIAFLFREYLPESFPRGAALAGVLLVVFASVPLGYLLWFGIEPAGLLHGNSRGGTLYIALGIGVPAGVFILSYRAQDEFRWLPLSPTLGAAMTVVSRSDFVHRSAHYHLHFKRKSADEVVMRCETSFTVVNRSRSQATYRDYVHPAGKNDRIHCAEINGNAVDHNSPKRMTKLGLTLTYEAAPGEQFHVLVISESTFHARDNESVGVFLPCEFLSIRIGTPPADLEVHIESLLPVEVDTKHLATGELLFEYDKGVLPFQGTRVHWAAKEVVP